MNKVHNVVALNLITAPLIEPITLAQSKEWLKSRLDLDIDDETITDLTKMAREYCERYTKRALLTQTWELVYSYQPSVVCFPLGQLQSVESVNVIQEDDTADLQDPSLYHTSLNTDQGKLWLKNNATWQTTERWYDNFKVRFVCGWDDVSKIPEVYKTGIKKLMAYMYENRNYTDNDVYLLLQQTGVGKLYTGI